ncbi:MAG: hypothetical protein KGN76_09440 [Acidobacteriota bacterium]|nr:hypothetical protein [Acidobacteriota bacterium]
MPAADRLLRLYPRAWRERYGDEFLALAGAGPLGPRQTFDVVCGAIDAWLSGDVRRAAASGRAATNHGGMQMLKSMLACERNAARYTVRDALIAALFLIGVTFLLTRLGQAASASGWPATGGVLTQFGFLVALTLSFPFWIMKGQPWRAQAAIMGTTLVFLAAIGYW